MNGRTLPPAIGILGAVPSDWQVKGIGDFDGDGNADVLWQHPATGTVAAWFMNGRTLPPAIGILGAVPSDWQVKGIGDFDGDGNADVLWQHPATGTVAAWFMNGRTTAPAIGMLGAVPSDWQVKPEVNSVPIITIPFLTGPSTATAGFSFTLTWTYTFGGLGSTQEGYELQESTNASFTSPTTPFNSINGNDNQSPKTYSITKSTAGTYYYRVRASDSPTGLTPWSSTLTVTVNPASTGPSLTGPSTVNTTVGFALTWTYTFGGLASNQDGYELQESMDASFSNPTVAYNSRNKNLSDYVSPKTVIVTGKNTAGTYYYRVRAQDTPVLTPWSNTLTVVVTAPATRSITLQNNISANLNLHEIVQVKVALTESGVYVRDDLLTDDWANCLYLPGESIPSGGSRKFNITIGNNYSVYIGVGIWDLNNVTCSWNYPWFKRTFFTEAGTYQPYYVWAVVNVTNHTSGDWLWTISGSYLNGTLAVTPQGNPAIYFFRRSYTPIP
jgi:hypothetical protein